MNKIKNSKIVNYINNHKAITMSCLFVFVFLVTFFVGHRFSLSFNDHPNFTYITSDNTNYMNGDPGAWILYKEANLVSKDRLQIEYDINSRNLLTEKDKDVLFVVNTANSAFYNESCRNHGGKASNILKSTAIEHFFSSCTLDRIAEAAERLLVEESENENTVGLIGYDENYSILSNFTNNETIIYNALESIQDGELSNYTNYAKALEGIDAFLQNYTFSNDRELKIVLLIGDVSTGNNNQEKALFEELKEKYPNMVIYALHNLLDYDQTILNKIKNISDYQYLINDGRYNGGIKSSPKDNKRGNIIGKEASFLVNVKFQIGAINPDKYYGSYIDIFQNIIFNKEYSKFKIIDNINNKYFSFDDFKVLSVNYGEVTHSFSDNQLTWSLDRTMITGDNAHLLVELSVKPGVEVEDTYVPVSTSTSIKSILDGVSDENISSTLTPYVQFYNNVYFQTWAVPDNCVVNPIEPVRYKVGDSVDLSDKTLSCPGYIFAGWTGGSVKNSYNYDIEDILSGEVKPHGTYLNIIDNMFVMPGNHVIVYPMFKKVNISKNLNKSSSILITGEQFSEKLVNLTSNKKNSIKAFIKADSLPDGFVPTSDNIISTVSSDLPTYAWFDSESKTIYYYSDSENIYLNSNSSYMFRYCNDLIDISGLQYLNASKVRLFKNTFTDCSKLENLSPISNWDVSNVTDFSHMFMGCKKLSSLDSLSNWNVQSAKTVMGMFASCVLLEDISALENWDVSNITNFESLFSSCYSLIDLSPISNWNVSKANDMSYMFSGCSKLENISPISNWNTSNTIEMNGLFYGCGKLADITPLSNWNVSKVKNMSYMFAEDSSLTSLDSLANWNVSKVEDMSYMFAYNSSLTSITGLANWNTSNVESMSYMFSGDNISDISPIANLDLSKVYVFSGVFSNNTALTSLDGLSNLNTSNFVNIESLFKGCTKLENIDGLANWNTSKIENISYMFSNCSKISSLEALRNWDVSNVKSMYETFRGCDLIESLDGLENWKTNSLTFMEFIFAYCDNLVDISALRNWNVSKVSRFNSIFDSDKKIVDISALENWNTSNAMEMKATFYNCESINTASYLNNWNIKNVSNFNGMFYNVPTHPEFTSRPGTWDDSGNYYPEDWGN